MYIISHFQVRSTRCHEILHSVHLTQTPFPPTVRQDTYGYPCCREMTLRHLLLAFYKGWGGGGGGSWRNETYLSNERQVAPEEHSITLHSGAD